MDIALEEVRLGRLSSGELRERYAALFGERTDSRNRHYLTRRILWRMQAQVEGGLSDRAVRRAMELGGNLADLRQSAPVPRAVVDDAPAVPATAVAEADSMEAVREPTVPRTASRTTNLPPPGTVLVRRYKGRDMQVLVHADGFEWDGRQFRSLSAVAKAITGSHWSGNLFFNISSSPNARTKGKS